MMSLSSLLALVLSDPKKVTDTVAGLVNMFKATTAAAPVTVPAVPATDTAPAVPAVTKKPSATIKSMQHLLNQVVKPQPPLKEDGWLGDKTEAAIASAIAMAQPYLAMLG
jgi:hypothetical protein